MSERPLEAYRAFVAAAPASDDGYLFDTPRCRFWPEPGDELVAAPGARAAAAPGGAAIEVLGARLPISGLDLPTLQRALAALPCSYARLALELGPRMTSFIEQAFSRVVFAPSAVAALELAQPACEIVRFPGSPYEIVRAYWQNLCGVRRRLDALEAPPSDVAAFRRLLLELHELTLLGEPETSGPRSFYLPASALARKRATPGQFYEGATSTERRAGEVVITSGARVSVPLLGGASYWQLLAESVSDEAALASERRLNLDGLDYGSVVQGRASEELQARPWFLPPRPLSERYFELLLGEWRAAWEALERGDVPALLSALAAFHYRFVRSHPLPSANQSVSMSCVNRLLRSALGIGIPHLLLDQLALRFELHAYGRLFARAARAWSKPWPSATDRLRSLLRMRGELNGFVSNLGSAASLIEARALLIDDAHGASLALLVEPGDVRLGIG
jgi:hypothetical protein